MLLVVIFASRALNFLGSVGGDKGWSGGSNLNLVLSSSDLTVLSYHPEQKTLSLVKIPEQTTLNIGLGFGAWQAGSVYQLGQSESPKIGGKLLKSGVTQTLGVHSDGYLAFKGKLEEVSGEEIITKLRENPLEIASIISNVETDLSLLDLTQILNAIRGVRFDKVEVVDLGESEATSWKVLSDGTRVLVVTPDILDSRLSGLFEEDAITSERKSISILNSSSQAGLADRAARVISNMGGRVVLTDSLHTEIPQSLVIGDSGSQTYQRLKQVFSPNCQLRKLFWIVLEDPCTKLAASLESELPEADIVIILGADYAKP